jgi:hypothetical protein
MQGSSTPPRLSPLTQKALDAARIRVDAPARLLAQQLSLKAHRGRGRRRAPVLTGTGALTRALLDRVGFKRAQDHVWREISHDLC